MLGKTQALMAEQVQGIYDGLTETFNLPVFEDEIAEDEEKKMADGYHCFVYETSNMKNSNDRKSLTQSVHVYYYSENLDDIDVRTIDIIRSLAGVKGLIFERTTKQRLQKKDTDRFIDRVILIYSRRIIVGCEI